MPHRVRIEPSGHEFDVEGDDTLLEAALRAGLALDYGCGNGNCGQCRARLLSGEVRATRHHDYVIGEADRLSGDVLACSVAPLTDVVVEAGEADSVAQIPQQRINAQLQEVRLLGDDLAAVTLRPPRSQRLRFLAGQRATLTAANLPPLELAIASCPCEEMRLEFHVPRLAGAPLTTALLDGTLRRFTPVTVEGPHGDFVLDRDACGALVFLAVGTGFAPVRSLVEHALALEQAPRIHLERLTLSPHGAYLDNLCRSWVDALDDFGYRAGPWPDDLVAWIDDFVTAQLTGDNVALYLAGPPERVKPLAEAIGAHVPTLPLRTATTGCPA
jgi:CDP-4-dehydro-6-deoxyglucose reductase